VSLRDRLERLETRAKPGGRGGFARSEKRERAFERLFRLLDELDSLSERLGPLSWDDPRVRQTIERHQRETREKLERGDPNG
jgi:3-methyladenine DNA glycosylase/8-oxoguanine DNA glycosylase